MRFRSSLVGFVKSPAAKHFAIVCVVLGMLGVHPLGTFAKMRPTAKCVNAGKVIDVAGTKFVCAKSAKKLEWTIVYEATTTTTTVAATTTTTIKTAVTTTVAATTTTTTTTVAADKTPPVVTLLRGAGSSSSPTLTFTVTGDETIKCSTLSTAYDEDFTWDKISIITVIVQTSPTVCTITANSTAERDNDDHLSTLRASARFSITDTAGNVQTKLLGSPQSTSVKRA